MEVLPVQTDQGMMVVLRDPSGMSDRVVTASVQVVALLGYFDGTHTMRDIQEDIAKVTGEIVPSVAMQRIVDVLDEALMLENPRFEAHRAAIVKEYADSPVRVAASAGHSYPEEPEALRKYLDDVLAEGAAALPSGAKPMRGLIAPHIDYDRGRKSYAPAFASLERAMGDAELFILLGTAHAAVSEKFALTRKDFATPLGRVKTDVTAVDAIAKASPRDLFADEFVHRAEHSIELELVFLQRVMERAKRDFRIVPVLCGGWHEEMEAGSAPDGNEAGQGVVSALRELIAREDGKAFVIAGADLAHVGPRFGTPEKITPGILARVGAADRESLAFVERGDAAGFFGHVALDLNARNICGIGPIWLALKALDPCAAELLGYEQWADDDGSSSVTFASCAIR